MYVWCDFLIAIMLASMNEDMTRRRRLALHVDTPPPPLPLEMQSALQSSFGSLHFSLSLSLSLSLSHVFDMIDNDLRSGATFDTSQLATPITYPDVRFSLSHSQYTN
jgi:hypothetical protein